MAAANPAVGPLHIMQQTDGEGHQQDGLDADTVAAEMLHQIGAESAKEEYTHTRSSHHHAQLPVAVVALEGQPQRKDRQEHVYRHRHQQAGQGDHPELFMPKVDMYGGILCIHRSKRIGLIGFCLVGEIQILHILYITADGIGHDRVEVGIAAQETRTEALGHTQHVGYHEYLAVGAATGTDTDGGDGYLTGDLGGQLGRHFLEHHSETARLGQNPGIGDELFRLFLFFSTNTVSAEFIDTLSRDYDYPLADLISFVQLNYDSFFDNLVSVGYTTADGTKIKPGMKLSKAFKFFVDDEDILDNIQTLASRIIQNNVLSGELCVSVHPLDFLSSSENSYNWRSCHSLNGEYRSGNLSYMVDSTTFIAYIKGKDKHVLPNFPNDVKWNSKKWRTLFFTSENFEVLFAGRQYPLRRY